MIKGGLFPNLPCVIAGGPDGFPQGCLIQLCFCDHRGLLFAPGRGDFLHREGSAHRVVHMALTHAAHHTCHPHSIFPHILPPPLLLLLVNANRRIIFSCQGNCPGNISLVSHTNQLAKSNQKHYRAASSGLSSPGTAQALAPGMVFRQEPLKTGYDRLANGTQSGCFERGATIQKHLNGVALERGEIRMCLPFIGVLIPFAGTAFRPAPYFGRCRSNGSPASAKRAGR